MGRPLCERIANATGVSSVVVHDADLETATTFAADLAASDISCAVMYGSLAEAAGAVDVVVSCLPNSRIVSSVVNDAIAASAELPLWIDATSGDPAVSKAVAERLRTSIGAGFLDCAVSGGPAGAAAGTVTAMVGGDVAYFDSPAAQLIVNSFAQNIVHLGPCGAGHAVKAINNTLMALNVWSTAEGLLALKEFGVEPAAALDAINGSSGRSWATLQRFPDHIVPSRAFDYGFSLELLSKDVDTCLALVGALRLARGATNELGARGMESGAPAPWTPSGAADDADATAILRALGRHEAPLMAVGQALLHASLAREGGDADHLEMVKTLETRIGFKV